MDKVYLNVTVRISDYSNRGNSQGQSEITISGTSLDVILNSTINWQSLVAEAKKQYYADAAENVIDGGK